MASLNRPRSNTARRFSLRLRVVLAVIAVAVAPQLLLVAWSQVDRNVPGQLWGTARNAVAESASIVAAEPDSSERQTKLDAIASHYRARVRVIDSAGALVSNADYGDVPSSSFDRFEAYFLGQSQEHSLAELDDTMGALGERAEVRNAPLDQPATTCHFVGLVYCQSALRVAVPKDRTSEIVLAQTSSRRAVQGVYALRYQLLRIALLTLPLSVALAFYMGRRVVEPLEALRDEALAQSSLATRNVALSVRQTDEVGDLARALNELLNTLETKRRDNEAFVADLVHELKNPVAAIRATAESVTADLTSERAERISRLLRDSTSKIDRLVTQFLELARAEAGMPNEIREPVDLVALLRGLVKSASDDERHKGVAFSFSSAHDRALVTGVDHRFEASFRELIENGASFAHAAGRVDVELKIEAAVVTVAISDSGPGIAAENLPRVFDRFFTTRDRERGTGLGLALVKAVAEAHGGSVRATSEVGNGACFYVELPLFVEAA